MSGIYVVEVRPLSEPIAVADLAEQGFQAYAPMVRRFGRTSTGRRVTIVKPLTPRYVFVGISLEAGTKAFDDALQQVLHARRVRGVMGQNDAPRPLPPRHVKWLADIHMSEMFGRLDYTSDHRPKCSIGQLVRINGGMFKGFVGELVALKGSRATVEGRGSRSWGKVTLAADQVGEVPVETDTAAA